MRARASFDPDETRQKPGEEYQQLAAPEASPESRTAGCVHTVDLKDGSGDIDSDGDNRHGRLPLSYRGKTRSTIRGAEGAVHAIKWAVQRARYMTLETISQMNGPLISLPAVAR